MHAQTGISTSQFTPATPVNQGVELPPDVAPESPKQTTIYTQSLTYAQAAMVFKKIPERLSTLLGFNPIKAAGFGVVIPQSPADTAVPAELRLYNGREGFFTDETSKKILLNKQLLDAYIQEYKPVNDNDLSNIALVILANEAWHAQDYHHKLETFNLIYPTLNAKQQAQINAIAEANNKAGDTGIKFGRSKGTELFSNITSRVLLNSLSFKNGTIRTGLLQELAAMDDAIAQNNYGNALPPIDGAYEMNHYLNTFNVMFSKTRSPDIKKALAAEQQHLLPYQAQAANTENNPGVLKLWQGSSWLTIEKNNDGSYTLKE
jgi:hypothetical protein